MPKQAHPWYRSQTDSWYVELRGKQQPLGRHPDGAPPPKKSKRRWNAPPEILQAYHRLMAEGPAIPKSEVISVAKVCDLFLDAICPFLNGRPDRKKRKKGEQFPLKPNAAYDARTYWWYDAYLQDFCKRYGRMPAKDLIELHVDQWLDAHPTWTTARRSAITALKRAFNWADKKGLLRPNPIKGVSRPPMPSRARTMTPAERRELLAAIPDRQFRLFVEAMQESGARPSEVSRVEAADCNLELGVWVLHKHKTGKKTGKPRVIYLTPRLLEITRELAEKYPVGPLFRGPRGGKPFGMHGICSRFRRLRIKLPHLKNAIAYAYRHSFTVDGLTNGVGIAQMAELLGHVDTSMVSRHYGRLSDQIGHLREAAAQATRKA